MGTISLPSAGTNGQPNDVTPVNSNFSTVETVINGNLDDANIQELSPSKLLPEGGVEGDLLVLTSGTWTPTKTTLPSQYKEATGSVTFPADTSVITVLEVDAAETWTLGTPLIIEFYAPQLSIEGESGSQSTQIALNDGATELGYLATAVTGEVGNTDSYPILVRRKLTASGAAQTFKITGKISVASASSNNYIRGGAGGVGTLLPMYLSVRPDVI
jgi:hypothetical protein